MAKHHKIKHYHRAGNIYKAKPHPVIMALWALGLIALVFVGISIYQPVYDMITGNHSFFANSETLVPPSQTSSAPPQQTEVSSPPEPVAEVLSGIRGVYLPWSILSNDAALDRFLDSLNATGTDTVIIDLKDSTGAVLFRTANADAISWNAVEQAAVDLPGLVKKLDGRGLRLAGRIWAFQDEKAARGNRENAIRYQDGDWLWLDNAADAGGKPWLNPMAPGAQQYIMDLAVEAVRAGTKLVILEEVRFADGSGSPNATFGAPASSAQRKETLRQFVADATAAVEAAGGHLGLHYAAEEIASASEVSAKAPQDSLSQIQIRYGGHPLELVADTLLVDVMPNRFQANYSQGGLILPNPRENPASTVSTVLEYVKRTMGNDSIRLIPLLQGGNESVNSTALYTREQLDDQIAAVQKLDIDGYILYQSQGNYIG